MTTCFAHSLFDIFVWQSVNVEPLLNIFVWQRAKVITSFMNCEWKWLKVNGFSSISILRKHFANDKVISPKINAILQTIFTHAQFFLCQSYLTFAHRLFGEWQCGLTFARCRKFGDIMECILDYSTCQLYTLNTLLQNKSVAELRCYITIRYKLFLKT